MDNYYANIIAKCGELSTEPTEDVVHVSIGEQKLRHYQAGHLVRDYTISTGRKPPSCVENSLGTPTGLHFIDEKIGDGAPVGMIFKGRVAQGKTFNQLTAEENEPNLITSRICWLRGLEDGINAGAGVDTHDRYIYIHGTNHEERLGTPDSHGCVLLSNAEMIQLFDLLPCGTKVLIEF
ncbi:L,D-transpeptidase [Rubellicoccus peritrichatus]|uniref:L,D-transpeptidase n=1 Tax=Rubellicoccus peritrichatus TaxID=3080537 RepID=A0AAQ3LBK0_9BACT|nr:L,D-transpeptidase [Puniceicoccus sp. CR14]WOO41332.1 L,D-transpeptidase [Puniceicoccus sp. CR14]